MRAYLQVYNVQVADKIAAHYTVHIPGPQLVVSKYTTKEIISKFILWRTSCAPSCALYDSM